MPLAPHCLQYEYVCGAGVVRGFVPFILALLFVARADGCLTGGRHVVLCVCWYLFVFVLALEACRAASLRPVSLRAAG